MIQTKPPVPRTTPPVETFRTQRLQHKGNLEQIARRNHTDMEDLLEANPGLRKWKGTGHIFPVGTTIRIPPMAA